MESWQTYKDGKVYTRKATRPRKGLDDLDWRDELKEFDILITPSGDLRVVRQANYDQFGRLLTVTFSIRKCSRFHGGFRHLSRWELKKYRKAEVRYRPTELDYEMREHLLTRFVEQDRTKYSCWNVKGFA